MLDVVDAGADGAFVEGNDPSCHVVGRQAVIAEDDADHRDLDGGKMSVGVRTAALAPKIRISSAITHEGIGARQGDLNDLDQDYLGVAVGPGQPVRPESWCPPASGQIAILPEERVLGAGWRRGTSTLALQVAEKIRARNWTLPGSSGRGL